MLYGLTKIGVLGSHGDGSNAIPAQYATTPEFKAYREGTVMRQLAIELAKLPGIVNLRPEATNISWSERARRLQQAGCDLGIDLHTNWSVNSAGVPNRGILVAIVPLYNPVHSVQEQTAMATQLYKPLADMMGFRFEIRTKKGSGEWDYYSFLYECNRARIPYPMIIEHGYHMDFAQDVAGNIAIVRQRYEQIVEGTSAEIYYRVSAGEYASTDEAETALLDLRARGYDAYISYYPRIQVGSFRIRANADSMVEKLRADGYPYAFITVFERN